MKEEYWYKFLLGNYLMYAPLDQKSKTASGQITLKELKKCHLK